MSDEVLQAGSMARSESGIIELAPAAEKSARRKMGFILVNCSPGVYALRREQEGEFQQLRAAGWRIARIRPICRSLRVKLRNLPPEVLCDRVFSYSLCILEEPAGRRDGPALH